MELLLEVMIYLLVVLGLITVCFTFFNKFKLLDLMVSNDISGNEQKSSRNTYSRVKNENEKIIMNIRYRNISNEELNKIKESIETANYINILDIVDEMNYIESAPKKAKKKS